MCKALHFILRVFNAPGRSFNRPLLPACLLLSAFIVQSHAAAPEKDGIGVAASIREKVTGELLEEKRDLSKGDNVFQNEAIETGVKAKAEFIFHDETKLAIGPNSRLRLDKYIYNPDKKTGDIILNAAAGSFRFITGVANKTAYRIKTPVATIGVRGTVFDGYVNDEGEVAVLLHDGEVEVCTKKCRRVKRKGRFVRVLRNGIFKGPHLWDASFFNNVGLATAFPFIGKRLIIDPVRRLNPAKLMRKAAIVPRKVLRATAKTQRKVARTSRKGARKVGRGVRRIGRNTGRGIQRFGRKTGRALRRIKLFRK